MKQDTQHGKTTIYSLNQDGTDAFQIEELKFKSRVVLNRLYRDGKLIEGTELDHYYSPQKVYYDQRCKVEDGLNVSMKSLEKHRVVVGIGQIMEEFFENQISLVTDLDSAQSRLLEI